MSRTRLAKKRAAQRFGIAAILAVMLTIVVVSVHEIEAAKPHVWISGTLTEREIVGSGRSPALRLRLEEQPMDFRVDVAEVCGRHGVAADAVLQTVPRLQGLAEDGIVRLDGQVLSVNDDMRFLVRSVASAFDAYLGASGRTHSRAV